MTRTKTILNKTDYDEIRRVVKSEVKEEVDKLLESRLSNLPTKDEYFTTMDALMKEIKAAREDLSAHKLTHETIDTDIKGLKTNVNTLYDILDTKPPVVQTVY